jgi:hypothetical protein
MIVLGQILVIDQFHSPNSKLSQNKLEGSFFKELFVATDFLNQNRFEFVVKWCTKLLPKLPPSSFQR